MKINWVLAESSRMRYAAGSSMYFAQGIPYGLMSIAVPAWLASQGVGAGQIASFLAVIILPWAFKLLSGPLMDRYQFLAMGRRRPWVLGAQLGMTLSFFGLVLVDNPVEQIGLLMILGLLINVFAATQDVAVDGMAIDVTPVDEQGRLNGFMVFGKAIGWGLTSAVTGTMLVKFGLGVTAIAAAAVQTVVLLGFMLTVERRGERRLPWSSGDVMSERRAVISFADLFKGLNAVLWTRVSMIVMAIMLFDGFIGGYGHALMPIAAINLFGLTTPEWSQLVAIMGLAGAASGPGSGPDDRSLRRQANADIDHLACCASRIPSRRDAVPVGERNLCQSDAGRLGVARPGDDGVHDRAGNDDLLRRDLGHAICHLHVAG